MVIWTLVHSNRNWGEFLTLLRSQRIEQVADVRRFAGSRKHPQFGQEELPQRLAASGLAYQHIVELGGRRRSNPGSINTVWRNPAFRAYADYTQTESYRSGRARLLQMAAHGRTALLCSEAVWWRCHRALIADDLKSVGILVLHIMSPTKVVEHPYTTAAKIVDGQLVYGPASPH
ncbi:DUF488 domain-containing protein [Thiohalomonas denitrificans]|uniref:DUF488 domain-containing protein n=1 Tax=Thiohalomonas denitrificans TaxID=415747 RepID=A0A1G5Q1L6_9GAMM|nr:DUF488 domain-containing protein [Thiohalomonas denitrificans]SCZ55775.1 Protein of unknown function, DUF488 [Thiohalomonas denitrificans]